MKRWILFCLFFFSLPVFGASITPGPWRPDNSTLEKSGVTVRVKDSGITGAKLNSNVADGSTLELNASALRVKDGGITLGKLFTASKTCSTAGYVLSASGTAAGLGVTLSVTGTRPVMLWVEPDAPTSADTDVKVKCTSSGAACDARVWFTTDAGTTCGVLDSADFLLYHYSTVNNGIHSYPLGVIRSFVFPTAGSKTFQICVNPSGPGGYGNTAAVQVGSTGSYKAKLCAVEL